MSCSNSRGIDETKAPKGRGWDRGLDVLRVEWRWRVRGGLGRG